MDDSQILDWLQAHGEEIYTVQIDGTGYLVLAWNDADGETQRTYGCDLRDAVRGAIAGEGRRGQERAGEGRRGQERACQGRSW